MTTVLVVNSGSSSFKYQLIDVDSGLPLASGLVERIGEELGAAKHTVLFSGDEGPGVTAVDATYRSELPIPNHTVGFGVMLDAFAEHGPSLEEFQPVAVGHRVVHGGNKFSSSAVITPAVIADIEALVDRVSSEIRSRFEKEVPSARIGELVIENLARLDQVAQRVPVPARTAVVMAAGRDRAGGELHDEGRPVGSACSTVYAGPRRGTETFGEVRERRPRGLQRKPQQGQSSRLQ